MDRNLHETFPPGYKWKVLAIIMIGTMMATLDSSIVNVSIPAIMSDFGSNLEDIEWIMTGYMLAFAALMPLTGWLRERIGYKNILISSLILFTVGSLLCGMAWNLPSLITARILQAIGGGAIMPPGMAMLFEVFPLKEIGKAMGFWGMGIIVGPAIGPTLGGYLTHSFGWRSIFLVNLPIGIIAVMMAAEMLLKDNLLSKIKKSFDFWGFAFLTIFLVSFLLGMSKGEKEGWLSVFIISCFILAITSFVGFMLVELHLKEGHGIVDLSLFKSPVFSIAAIIAVVRSIGLFGGVFLIPLFLQQQMGYNELQSGLIMLPSSLLMAFVLPFVGRMADKVGPKIPSLIGLVLMAYSLIVYKTIDVNTSLWDLINPMLIRSFGMALLMAPITTAAMNSVPSRKAGMASSLMNIIQQVGGSIGIAFFATALSNRAHYHISIVSESAKSTNPAFIEAASKIIQHVHTMGFSYSQSMTAAKIAIVKTMTKAAMVMSFQDAFIIGGIIVALAIPMAIFLPSKAVHHVHGESKEGGRAIIID